MGIIRDNVQRNLERFIELSSMNQKEFAEKLGVSQSAVTNWIKGKNAPDIEMVANICEVLNISVAELFETKKEDSSDGKEPIFSEDNDPFVSQIAEIYKTLSDDNRKYLQGYVHRLLEEQKLENMSTNSRSQDSKDTELEKNNVPTQQELNAQRELDEAADEFAATAAELAREQFLEEKRRERQVSFVKKSDAG